MRRISCCTVFLLIPKAEAISRECILPKPVVFKSQLTVLPKVFRAEIPEPFARELRKCADDAEVREVGVEWCIQQCKDLIAHGVPSLHFYTMMASDSVYRVAREIY